MVGFVEESMLDVIDVVGGKRPPPRIEDQPEPASGPPGPFDHAGVRIEGEIILAQIQQRRAAPA